MTPLLELQGVTAGHGRVPVLRDLDLRVLPGEICAVLGANGAGKTTLLRLLSGLLRPVAGQVVYAGRNNAGRRPEELVRLGVAHVPAGAGVVPELTVAENLGLAVLWRRDGSVRRDLAQVYEVFEPLARRRGDPGHRLSAGERQMLALARALVTNPRLLLVDEPSRGLPPRVVADVLALLRRLRESTGLTVLLAEQNVHGALSVADRGVVLVQGRIDRADASRLGSDDRRRHAYLGF